MADKNIDGFRFSDAEDADTARQELDRIKYIAERINEESPQAVLAVYNKSIQSNIFLTPVGLEYLRSLQRFLYKSEEIPDDQIMDIPVRISFNDALRQRTKKRFDSIDEDKRKKNFKKEYRISLIINAVLILMVIAMFVIAYTGNNANVLNYKTAIINEYSGWEEDLDARERELKIRESELKEKEIELRGD